MARYIANKSMLSELGEGCQTQGCTSWQPKFGEITQKDAGEINHIETKWPGTPLFFPGGNGGGGGWGGGGRWGGGGGGVGGRQKKRPNRQGTRPNRLKKDLTRKKDYWWRSHGRKERPNRLKKGPSRYKKRLFLGLRGGQSAKKNLTGRWEKHNREEKDLTGKKNDRHKKRPNR